MTYARININRDRQLVLFCKNNSCVILSQTLYIYTIADVQWESFFCKFLLNIFVVIFYPWDDDGLQSSGITAFKK